MDQSALLSKIVFHHGVAEGAGNQLFIWREAFRQAQGLSKVDGISPNKSLVSVKKTDFIPCLSALEGLCFSSQRDGVYDPIAVSRYSAQKKLVSQRVCRDLTGHL
jgi:hypothetical protein